MRCGIADVEGQYPRGGGYGCTAGACCCSSDPGEPLRVDEIQCRWARADDQAGGAAPPAPAAQAQATAPAAPAPAPAQAQAAPAGGAGSAENLFAVSCNFPIPGANGHEQVN